MTSDVAKQPDAPEAISDKSREEQNPLTNTNTTQDWVMVPREPTREMWAAMADSLYGYKNRHHDKVTEDLWAAMLSAAPTISPRMEGLAQLIFDTVSPLLAEQSEPNVADYKRAILSALSAVSGLGKEGLGADPSEPDLVCGDVGPPPHAAPGEEGQS